MAKAAAGAEHGSGGRAAVSVGGRPGAHALGLVARRRRLLRYLLGRDSARHHALVERLGLRH